MRTLSGKYNSANIMIDSIDDATREQIQTFLDPPAFAKTYIAVMPDCLTDDTEVLTPQGFQRITALTKDTPIANIDVDTKQVSFSTPKNIVMRSLRINEQVYSVSCKAIGLRITSTEGHRNAYIPEMGCRTNALPTKTCVNDYIWAAEGVNIDAPISDGLLQLIAWTVGDGSIRKSGKANYLIRFGLKKSRKISRILDVCTSAGLQPHIHTDEKQTIIELPVEDSKDIVSWITPQKTYPWSFLHLLSKRQARMFLDEAIQVDGDYAAYKRRRGIRLNTSKRDQADFLAALASCNGYATVTRCRETVSNLTRRKHTMYYVCIVPIEHIHEHSLSGYGHKTLEKERVKYTGKVVCVECNTSYFLARQAGRTFVTGNCHAGVGAVVGFTAKMNDYIIPNIVGVDINCGVSAYNLGRAQIDFAALDTFIRHNIPSGFTIRGDRQTGIYRNSRHPG